MFAQPAPAVKDFPLETGKWKIEWTLDKFHNCDTYEDTIGLEPDETISHSGNLLMYGGVSVLWEALIGNGTGTAGQTLTFFNNANAAIGVGDSSTAAAATQTDLQASSNKLRVAMNGGFPTHTDGVTSPSATITFQASFGSVQANYAWNEVSIFNSASAGIGRMLNRLVQSFGTKSGGTWSMTVTVTIS